jgi:hypothetical protein
MYDILGKLNKISEKETLKENAVKAVAELAGAEPTTPKGKLFAALAEPKDKITFADKIAGAKKHKKIADEGNAFTGALAKAPKGGKFKVGGKEFTDTSSLEEGTCPTCDCSPCKCNESLDMKLLKGAQGSMKGVNTDSESERNRHKKYGYRSDRDDTGNDDDYDEFGNEKKSKKSKNKDEGPKKKGRPAGTKRKIGAKGPTGKSKLLSKGSIKEGEVEPEEQGEYGQEGEMAKEQLHTIRRAANELESILGDNEDLPEWVQEKLANVKGMLVSASEYMQTQHERDEEEETGKEGITSDAEEELDEKAINKYAVGMAAAKKKFDYGDEPAHDLPKKVIKKGHEIAKKVKETTTSGSVAVAAPSGKASSYVGKGVYESFNNKVESMINEGMSVNVSVDETGKKSINVSATDEDAEQLAQLLKFAGLGGSANKEEACSDCGSTDCGCDQVDEELANSPEEKTQDSDYMLNTLAGGANKPKSMYKDSYRQGDNPMAMKEAADLENHLTSLYKQFK